MAKGRKTGGRVKGTKNRRSIERELRSARAAVAIVASLEEPEPE
jgi:hypothetical protein